MFLIALRFGLNIEANKLPTTERLTIVLVAKLQSTQKKEVYQ